MITIEQGTGVIELVDPRALYTLEEVGIQDASLVMRPVDKEHVQSLTTVAMDQLPALDCAIVRTHDGSRCLAIVDGMHRRLAAITRKDAQIAVKLGAYQNEAQVVETAFMANLNHGLPAGRATKTNYVLWLARTYPNLGNNEIARRARMDKGNVSRILSKERGEDEGMISREQDDSKQLYKIADRMKKVTNDFIDMMQGRDIDECAELLVDAYYARDAQELCRNFVDMGDILLTTAVKLKQAYGL